MLNEDIFHIALVILRNGHKSFHCDLAVPKSTLYINSILGKKEKQEENTSVTVG